MHRNDRTVGKQRQAEALRDWDYRSGPPPAGREAPPLRDEPTVPAAHPGVSEDAIRVRAYYKWVAAGRPEGDGVAFWLAAEQELRREAALRR